MLPNYFKIAWRNLVRNKLYSGINIMGLAIGLSVCMLIMLYVAHEASYDTFHKNAKRIYWIQGRIKMGNDSMFVPAMSYATGPLAKEAEPAVESFVRFRKEGNNTIIQNSQSPSLKFAEDKFLFADSNFFNFFSFRLVQGNKNQVLENPFTVVISQNAANKYFGNQNPVGKVIRYNNAYNFTITGVAEKAPSNSSIDYDFAASLSSLSSVTEEKGLTQSQSVQPGAFATYFLLKQPQDGFRLEGRLLQLSRAADKNGDDNERYIATPFTDTHLKANYSDASNTKYIKVFPFVAALILLLALTNYMSLSTARSTIRAKEIGVRKVLGADRKTIAGQFFIESALFTAIAFALSYMLCFICQPFFFNFLQIDLDKSFLFHPYMLLSFCGLFVITVLLAATYPSILLSAYKPVLVLYGKFSKQSGGINVRQFFTVFQFAVSVILIICGVVIYNQLYFFKHAATGMNRENVLMVPFGPSAGNHYAAFKKETQSLPAIEQVTTANHLMYKGYDMFFTKPANGNKDVTLSAFSVDENFISLLGLQWKMAPQDSSAYLKQNAVVLNEAAVEKLDLTAPVTGERIPMANKQYEVAGVLKDFNYETLHNKIGALALFITKDTATEWGQMGGCFFAKIKTNVNMPSVIKQIKSIYEKYGNEKPFEYYFMDDAFDAQYKAEDRLSKIFGAFTAFTLFIACLGLFGLATFTAEQRTKEIGIRKVLGASVAGIVSMLSKDFIKLISISFVIASPIAWWVMSQWLQNFAYRIQISGWIFLAAGFFVVFIALLAVSFRAIKAAIANPVKSLRTE